MSSDIQHCEYDGKQGFKAGKNGYCWTYNKNERSKLRAYAKAKVDTVREDKNISDIYEYLNREKIGK